jgi:hypothetical protein
MHLQAYKGMYTVTFLSGQTSSDSTLLVFLLLLHLLHLPRHHHLHLLIFLITPILFLIIFIFFLMFVIKLLRLLLNALVALVADQRQLGAMTATPVVISKSNRVASLQQMFLQLDQVFRRFKIPVPRACVSGWPEVWHLRSVVNLYQDLHRQDHVCHLIGIA